MSLSAKEEYIAQCMTTGKTREECEQLWNEAQKSTDQETKAEYMKNCMGGGKSREECEAAWNEGHNASDYGTLVHENAMNRVKIEQLTKMLKEATDIIKAVNAERDAVTDARKYELAVEIERDSLGRLKHTDLMKENLKELTIMKRAIDMARPKDFVSTSALLEEQARNKEPMLSVGEYDASTKKWKGGIKP
jgi:hypothetical protein